MKSTGVVRRIDELGRIVVPKEIRRTLKIRDGENMEIFIDEESIILKKFSKMGDSVTYTKKLIELITCVSNCKIIITDRDHVIAHSDDINEILNKPISEELIELIDNRKSIIGEQKNILKVTQDKEFDCYYVVYPIIASADSIGLIISISEEKIDNSFILLLQFISILISNQFEIS